MSTSRHGLLKHVCMKEPFASEMHANLHAVYQNEASKIRMLMDSTLQERRRLEMVHYVLGREVENRENRAYQLGYGNRHRACQCRACR